MGNSSSATTSSTRYTHDSWFTKIGDDDYVHVTVRSVYVKTIGFIPVGNHHFLAIDGIDDKWRILQWGNGEGTWVTDDLTRHAAPTVKGDHCADLGRYKWKDVWRAVMKESEGYTYSVSGYNCNSWSEDVAKTLTGSSYRFAAHGCGC